MNRLTKIIQEVGMSGPNYNLVLATHDIVANSEISCPFRSGRERIEYNPIIIEQLTNTEVKLFLEAEIIRILLGHPYERRPVGCSERALSIASNLVLSDNYEFSSIGFEKPSDLGLDSGQSYEYYAVEIEKREKKNIDESSQEQAAQSSTSSGARDTDKVGKNINAPTDIISYINQEGATDLCQLWEENEDIEVQIEEITLHATEYNQSRREIGNACGNGEEQIESISYPGRLNFKKILSIFSLNVQGASTILTRMRPNRRMGFERMGRKRKYQTNLLIGIDVSGSVCTTTLNIFLTLINRLFKYVDKIDIATFDSHLGEVVTWNKASPQLSLIGRGGTCFQPIVDYYKEHSQYAGLIVFTDGGAMKPRYADKRKIAWVIDDKLNYEDVIQRNFQEYGLCCYIDSEDYENI